MTPRLLGHRKRFPCVLRPASSLAQGIGQISGQQKREPISSLPANTQEVNRMLEVEYQRYAKATDASIAMSNPHEMQKRLGILSPISFPFPFMLRSREQW